MGSAPVPERVIELKSEVNPVIIIVSVVALLAVLGGVGFAVFGPKKLSTSDDAAMRAKYMPGSAAGTPIKNKSSNMASSKAPPPGAKMPGRPGGGMQGGMQGYGNRGGGMQGGYGGQGGMQGGMQGYPGGMQRPGGQ